MLARRDFVTLHVPETAQTRGMIGAAELAMMKPGACLLNASRGTVVDIDGARRGDRGAATSPARRVDVYPEEPEGNERRLHVAVLQGLTNVILTPHIGGSTEEAQESDRPARSPAALLKFVENGRTAGCVNFPQLDMPPPASLRGTTACGC